MKTLTIIFGVILAFCICGCSKEKTEVEVTKDNFSKFASPKFTKVFIVCVPFRKDPNRMQSPYCYEFPFNDPAKVEVIKLCIAEANYTEYDRERFTKMTGKNRWRFVFETKKTRYNMYIGWDNKSVYGVWWESPELLSIFRGWGLFEDVAKADPNWPPPYWWKHPPKESDPNWPPLKWKTQPPKESEPNRQ